MMCRNNRYVSATALAGAFLIGAAAGFMFSQIKKNAGNAGKTFNFKDCEFHGSLEDDFFIDELDCEEEDCDCGDERCDCCETEAGVCEADGGADEAGGVSE
ncbi:MAG: hypothetical protein LBL09_01770 [Oscillospiraceae bacterium]|jgi:hypothetical protein|nr:hypothetical protein [Oscillospiraceae bacterium]